MKSDGEVGIHEDQGIGQNLMLDPLALMRKYRSKGALGGLYTTPHVLSQVSDPTDMSGPDLARVRALFSTVIEQTEEFYTPSRELVKDPVFTPLGLTDAAIATVCSKGILVVTVDLDLHIALQNRGADSLNFNHVRAMGWS